MGILSDKIEHIVVLMLENRSFDSMLGGLPGVDGLSGKESNPLQGAGSIRVWSEANTDIDAMSIPTPDPGELWDDINMQLFGLGATPNKRPPPMNGFVNNYVKQPDWPTAKSIMHFYQPSQVPILSALATEFAVCDQWFASAPCQTWPNRFFLHTGTAAGYPNNSPVHFPYMMDTIFNRLHESGTPWGIYFHDFPQTLTLSKLWPYLEHFHFFDEFKEHAQKGKLPAYTFIEPRYFAELELPNDQHPPHHVGLGEDLIADVYNTLRQSPSWENTLLVIIYDEHGGCYDHVPPPAAIPPDDSHPEPFGFDRYGVRVPAVLVSPFIAKGTVLRRPPDGTPFDHTSVIATLRKRFHIDRPLTRRDAVAPDLASVFTLTEPRQDCPETLTPLSYTIPPDRLEAALHAPLNEFQKAMHEAARHLPALGAVADLEDKLDAITAHIENLAQGEPAQNPNPHGTAAEALPFIKDKLKAFLGG